MEIVVLTVLAIIVVIVAGSISGIAALTSVGRLNRKVADLEDEMRRKGEQLEVLLARHRATAGQVASSPAVISKAAEPELSTQPPAPSESPAVAPSAGLPADRGPSTQPPAPSESPAVAPSAGMPLDAAPSSTNSKAEPVATADAEATENEWWSTFEQRIGKRWVTWAGALALFLGMGFFIRLAVEQGWIGPWGRVGLGVAVGVALVGAGFRFVLRQMRPLGQGLAGGGLAILYTVIYGAYGYYQLTNGPTTFLVMALVTALGVGLAVGFNARTVAYLAVIGGLATPLLLWNGINPGNGLFAYLLVLDLGVLFVAMRRRWRALDLLAMLGTWGIVFLWSVAFRGPNELLMPLMWAGIFSAVFLTLPFAYHLRLRSRIPRERLAMALSSGCIAFSFVVMVALENASILGGAAIALGLSYLVVAFATRRRIEKDSKALVSLISMATGFLTLAVPILLDFHAVTITWAVEGLLLVYLGYRYRYLPDRVWGIGSLLLAAGHVIVVNWPLGLAELPLLNASMGTVAIVGISLGFYAWMARRFRAVGGENEGTLGMFAAFAGLALVMVGLNTDLWGWLDTRAADEVQCWASAALWLIGAVAAFLYGLNQRLLSARVAALAMLLATMGFTMAGYSLGWSESTLLLANGRFLVALAAVAALFSVGAIYHWSGRRTETEAAAVSMIIGLGGTLAACLVSVELWFGLNSIGLTELAMQSVLFVWLIAAGFSAAWTLRGWAVGLRWLSLFQVSLAMFMLASTYWPFEPTALGVVVLNPRFFAALIGAGLIGLVAFLTRREAVESDEDDLLALSHGLWGAIWLGLLGACSIEVWSWLDYSTQGSFLRTIFPLLWAIGAITMMYLADRLRSSGLRHFSMVLLFAAGGLSVWGYAVPLSGGALLFLNERFFAAAVVVALFFVSGFMLRRWHDEEDWEAARAEGASFYAIGGALVLLLLSSESYLFFRTTVADPEQARWMAQMALSIVWAICAVVGVSAGFMRRERAVRLAGLALFALTAGKLLLVDTASIEGLYRIISFMVVGLLMIGVSYLYHRLEKRIEATVAMAPSR